MEEENNAQSTNENAPQKKAGHDPGGYVSTIIALIVVAVGLVLLFMNTNPFDYFARLFSGEENWFVFIFAALVSIGCAVWVRYRRSDSLLLNVILKIIGAPAFLIGLVIVRGAEQPQGRPSDGGASNVAIDRAAASYKQAAVNKAGAVARGHTESAAVNQRKMDYAMADMLTGGKKTQASEAYKRAALHKSGAEMTGRKADAAFAQAQMDKALADMIRDNQKN